MRIIGVDPGLASLGLADMRVTAEGARIVKLRIVHTKPSPAKRHLRSADVLTDRLRDISRQVYEFLDGDPVTVFACEVKAIPFRGGKMQVKPSIIAALGRVRGLFDAIAAASAVCIIDEQPQALKKLLCGAQSASKDQVIAAALTRFPELEDLWPKNKGDREHVADAVGMCALALESDVVRTAMRMMLHRENAEAVA